MNTLIDVNLPWLTLLIIWPSVGAVLLWSLRGEVGRKYGRQIALGFSIVQVGLAVLASLSFDYAQAGVVQLEETHNWITHIGASYAVGVNGVGLMLIWLSVFLTPLVILAAWREQKQDLNRLRHYLALILVLETFMVAIFAARDVFLFYVVFEAMLIPVYFLVGRFGNAQRRAAAIKFLICSLAGGLVMLVAVIGLVVQGPGGPQAFLVDNLTGLALDPTLEKWLFLGFFIAFAIKAPMFPVHAWLPDTAQAAPVGTSTLLVGVLDKVGTFGMLTLCLPLFPNASSWAAPVICVLAVISILYGALLAIGQRDLLRLIAYTSVSHFGFIVLGIFIGNETAAAGASFYMFNHGISTGALFLLAGVLIARRGTADITAFGGWQRVTPVLAGTFLVAGLSALGLPGLSTFVSEYMVIVGSLAISKPLGVLAGLGVVLAAIYVLRTYQQIFTGPAEGEHAKARDLSKREKAVIAPLIAGLVALGFFPAPMVDLVQPSAAESVTQVTVDHSAAVVEGSEQ